MGFVRLFAVVSAAFGILAASATAAPLETYGRLPSIEQVALSPDGALLALAMTDGDARNVLIREVATGANLTMLRAGDIKVRDLRWAAPDKLVITTSVTSGITDVIAPRSEWMMSQVYDVKTRKQDRLLRDIPDSLNVVAAPPAPRMVGGKPYVYITGIHFVDHQGQVGLFEVDLTTGKNKLVEWGQRDTSEWVVGPDGRAVAQALHNRNSGAWSMLVRKGGEWQRVDIDDTSDDAPDLVGLGRADDTILVSQLRDGAYVLREYVIGEGVWRDPLPASDPDDVLHDPGTHRLVAIHRLKGDDDEITFFDPADERAWRAVTGAYPGQRVELVSSSDDRKRMVVRVDSPTEGPAFAFVDLGARKADWIGGQYQGLKPEDISPVRPVRFKAADGLELSGYLTLPRGREAKNLPLVVFPHGGPAARDTPGFDWWAQGMASRGYAVLQVNFRGSDGFGHDFLEAGFGEWGRKMQTDLSDGVAYLTGQGIVDPKRVCIVGASYGGYAALAGAALQPGVYRCAVSVAGVSDLRRMVGWTKGRFGGAAMRYWTRFMGAEDARDPVLTTYSPAAQAEAVQGPVLLIHGRDDTVVPLDQSQVMANALKKAKKPVELIVQKGQDHWLTRGETRLETLTATVAFLEKHNPPD